VLYAGNIDHSFRPTYFVVENAMVPRISIRSLRLQPGTFVIGEKKTFATQRK